MLAFVLGLRLAGRAVRGRFSHRRPSPEVALRASAGPSGLPPAAANPMKKRELDLSLVLRLCTTIRAPGDWQGIGDGVFTIGPF